MIRIVTDSVSSIPPQVAKEDGIDLVSLFVNCDGQEFVETEMDIDGFYATLADRMDNLPTSSQPSQMELEAYFEDAAKAGDSVLGIFLSSKLSGTYEGVVRAARMVKSHYLDFTSVLIDSASAGYDEAFPALDAAECRDEGADLAECAAAAVNAIMCSRILFVPESLEFLRAGGRIGSMSALLGNLIKIVPMITVKDGTPQPVAKVRTMKKAVDAMVDTFKKDVEEFGLKRVVVHYIGEKTKMLEGLHAKIEEIAGRSVDVRPVSPVLGVHVGPAVGLAYECVQYVRDKYNGEAKDLVFTI